MLRKIYLLILFCSVFLLTSLAPSIPHVRKTISHSVNNQKGINDCRDARYPEKIVSGQPDAETIKQYDKAHDIPLLEIDPTQIDTTQYTNWYKFWTRVPLSNGFASPIQVGDIDHNGQPELYGGYTRYGLDFMSKIYEVDTTGLVTFRYQYLPRLGASMQITDVDSNGLQEICFQLGDSSFFYEQHSRDSLPIYRKFAHSKFDYPGTAIFGIEPIAEMDGDSFPDYVYRGTLPDSTVQAGYQYYTFVAEYNPAINNFQKVWKTQLWPPNGEAGVGGYDVGEYDGDEKMEFLASGMQGQVWVVENTGDNSYALTFHDSLPFVNLFYQTSGDVDGDGEREFFVSATMNSGNWITVYETTDDNMFVPTFQFHLLSGGTMDDPTLMTKDVNGDGKPELIVLSGADLYIFTSRADNTYELWYYQKNDAKQSIQFYDFDQDGKMDFIITKAIGEQFGLYFYGDIFVARETPTEVADKITLPREIKLYQNYPNPFNPATTIAFDLPLRQHVHLSVYDLLGNIKSSLVDGILDAGNHKVVWSGAKLPSGVYFYQLSVQKETVTHKMLLVK